MPIDLYTPRTLAGVLERTPRVKTFLRDTFFKDVVTFDTARVEFDMVKGGRDMARFVHPKLDMPVVKTEGFTTRSFEPPLVAETTVTTADDLMVRQPGEHVYSGVSPEARAVRKLSRDMRKLDEMVARREEWMAAKTIFEGKIPVVGEGLDTEIDFDFTNSVTLTKDKWSDPGTDILGQLEDWVEQVQKEGYTNPNVVIMDRAAANALVNSAQMKELLDVRRYDLAVIAPKNLPNGAKYIGSYGKLGLDFYQYNEWYLDNWTDPKNPVTKQLVPEGTVALMSTEAKFSMLYGAITYIPWESQDYITEEGKHVAGAWVERNPDRKMLALRSRPLTVPHEVDSWLVAKVL